MCPIAPLGLHISDLGRSQDLSVREKSFLIIVQDSGQTSILDDLDYLEFKDGSSLIPLDSRSLRTPDTVELDWSQRGENEPQVGAWKEGLGGREFLAEMNQHGIVGRRAQAMEPHV
jgi:hypothetical protein